MVMIDMPSFYGLMNKDSFAVAKPYNYQNKIYLSIYLDEIYRKDINGQVFSFNSHYEAFLKARQLLPSSFNDMCSVEYVISPEHIKGIYYLACGERPLQRLSSLIISYKDFAKFVPYV